MLMRNVIETMMELAKVIMETADGTPNDIDYFPVTDEAKFTYILDNEQKVELTVKGASENGQ